MGERVRPLGYLKLHAAAGVSPGMNGRGACSHTSGLGISTVLEFPQF